MKGGLGNQLFCYAAARRLALANNAELVIDAVTGFVRDFQYRRKYALDRFSITARKATPLERLEPFERYRRGLKKWLYSRKEFSRRRYLEQEGMDFDERLFNLRIRGTIHLEGYWQSEKYFKDVEKTIRNDLCIIIPEDAANLGMAGIIRERNSIALHMRCFAVQGNNAIQNIPIAYYHRAIAFMESNLEAPYYFVFSDDPGAARAQLFLPEGRGTFVSNNRGNGNAYADLWLMGLCKHFIIANSTFSWWGAWLAENEKKIVIAPGIKIAGMPAWGFDGLLPDGWILL